MPYLIVTSFERLPASRVAGVIGELSVEDRYIATQIFPRTHSAVTIDRLLWSYFTSIRRLASSRRKRNVGTRTWSPSTEVHPLELYSKISYIVLLLMARLLPMPAMLGEKSLNMV